MEIIITIMFVLMMYRLSVNLDKDIVKQYDYMRNQMVNERDLK